MGTLSNMSILHDVVKINFFRLARVTDGTRLFFLRGLSKQNDLVVKEKCTQHYLKDKTKKHKKNLKPKPSNLSKDDLDLRSLLASTPVLQQDLNKEIYVEKLSALIQLEEIRLREMLKEFNMEDVLFIEKENCYCLFVPAVSEGLLYILVNEEITATMSDDLKKIFKGRVVNVDDGELEIQFKDNFKKHAHKNFNVEFVFNRKSIVRLYAALKDSKAYLENVLFPTTVPSCKPQRSVTDDFPFFNRSLNSCQELAVRNILSGTSRPMPYILFGPPGTGKTVTLIETILQIYTQIPNSRILVCAPSNSAVNILTLKLHESGKVDHETMARHISSGLIKYEKVFSSNALREIAVQYAVHVKRLAQAEKYRIMLSTCNGAGAIRQAGVPTGNFTHVFMDEIGQGTEPEALVPLSLISGKKGQVVLSGDPYQLGPVVRCPLAKRFGLGESLLSRLMKSAPYQRNKKKFMTYETYDPSVITKLNDNYRSHPDFIEPSSKLFYNGELNAMAFVSETHKYCDWEELPVSGVPIMYHSVWGKEEQDDDNPSRYNTIEIGVVLNYLHKLFHRYEHLTVDEIGIITPYKKQAEKIQKETAQLGWDITVGSVEKFQGLEKSIIIISTVRSPDVDYDYTNIRSLLGFLTDPHRFNVAVTRAKALLIVIGNPDIFMKEPTWRTFIMYCKKLGVFIDYEQEVE